MTATKWNWPANGSSSDTRTLESRGNSRKSRKNQKRLGLGSHGKVEQPPLYELSPGDYSLPAGASHGSRLHPDHAISLQQAHNASNRAQAARTPGKVDCFKRFHRQHERIPR